MRYQVPNTQDPGKDKDRVLGFPAIAWDSLDTDITCLELRPRTNAARNQQVEAKYLDWHLLPLWFPETDIMTHGEQHIADVYPCKLMASASSLQSVFIAR